MGFSLKGEIRGVRDREFRYNDQNGAPKIGREVSLAVELAAGDNVEVKFTRAQVDAGVHEKFAVLKGKEMVLPVDVGTRKGYLNVYLSSSFAFPVAPAAAPGRAAGTA